MDLLKKPSRSITLIFSSIGRFLDGLNVSSNITKVMVAYACSIALAVTGFNIDHILNIAN